MPPANLQRRERDQLELALDRKLNNNVVVITKSIQNCELLGFDIGLHLCKDTRTRAKFYDCQLSIGYFLRAGNPCIPGRSVFVEGRCECINEDMIGPSCVPGRSTSSVAIDVNN